MSYSDILNNTPQTVQAKEGQVKNHSGGYVFQVSPWILLDRFLILGTLSGTYYVGAHQLTAEAFSSLKPILDSEGVRVVNRIIQISEEGRAVKQDPSLFLLAYLTTSSNYETKKAAYSAVKRVCRTGSQLLGFVAEADKLRGWGSGFRECLTDWILSKTPQEYAFQVLKYGNRNGWTQRDILRKIKPKSESHNDTFRYIVGKGVGENIPEAVRQYEALRGMSTNQVAKYVSDNRIPREFIPTEHLRSPDVWSAMLPEMPMTAMIRNLGTMGARGILGINSEGARIVQEKLRNTEYLKSSRIHPFSILLAMATYNSGKGLRGSNIWQINQQIVSALESAFYASFQNVEPTGKRFYLGIDVSGSMTSKILGSNISSCMAASAMAMTTFRSESASCAYGFCDRMVDLGIKPSDSLSDLMSKTSLHNFGRTDATVAMQHALREKIPVDVFVVYTDNDTYAGAQHPFQALKEYREKTGIDAKLCVVAFSSTRFSIADPSDPGMLDIAGLDSALPSILSAFATL